ncbi:unnamed protein product [Chironomus riparius]|uniref:Uncharacterized protein n=1 Tax=Chironomus riparius TaxID=315576 RepID=A0A9N9RN35_9DIPT|nr:unnamed protein product [Chironomus riparius]
MGNLVTKITTNNQQLNESNVSDIVVYEQKQVKKDVKDNKSPTALKAGLFKNAFFGNFDPRSPSAFIARTPIQIFRTGSSSKFNHQELLNESLNDTVDIDILTAEEHESLNSNTDLVDAVNKEEASVDKLEDNNKLPDPRSPTNEIARTPILIADEKKKTEDNLMKKITDKLIAAKIATDNDENEQNKGTESANSKKKSKPAEKNLIFEDDSENFDRFSTPPKKMNAQIGNDRTPLSCLANKARGSQPRNLLTSTPKGSKIPIFRDRTSASRIPRRLE